MSDRGKPLQPVHIFKKLIWRSTLSISDPLERFTTWTLTGVAAMTALFIANLASIRTVISDSALESSIVLFTLSLLLGAFSKQFGTALTSGLRTIVQVEQYLNSEDGKNLMDSLEISPEQLQEEIAHPFPWPMSAMLRRSGRKGLDDYLSADKTYIRMFAVQLALNLGHQLLAVAGLAIIGISFT